MGCSIWCDHYLLTQYESKANVRIGAIDVLTCDANGRTTLTHKHIRIRASSQQPAARTIWEMIIKFMRQKEADYTVQWKIRFVSFLLLSVVCISICETSSFAELTNSHSEWFYSWRCDFIFFASTAEAGTLMAQRNIHFVSKCHFAIKTTNRKRNVWPGNGKQRKWHKKKIDEIFVHSERCWNGRYDRWADGIVIYSKIEWHNKWLRRCCDSALHYGWMHSRLCIFFANISAFRPIIVITNFATVEIRNLFLVGRLAERTHYKLSFLRIVRD